MYIIEKTDIQIEFTAPNYADPDANVRTEFDVIFPHTAKTTAEVRRYTRHGAGLDAIEALVMADALAEGIPVSDAGITAMFISADTAAAIRRRLDKIAFEANTMGDDTVAGLKAAAKAERAGLDRRMTGRWIVTANAVGIAYYKTALNILTKRTLDRMNRLGIYAVRVTEKIERMRADGTFDKLPKRVQAKVNEREARAKAHAAAAAAFANTLASEGFDD